MAAAYMREMTCPGCSAGASAQFLDPHPDA
jgi:hypothetical protein